MEKSHFENSTSGKVIKAIGGYWAFIPNELPPKITWDDSLISLVSKAENAVGKISGLGENLPNVYLLVYPFIKREAVLSSRIEGTQSSFSDLLVFEATKIERKEDVKEIQNYVRAMEYGLSRVNELPLSLRLFRELHDLLLNGVRGENKDPGKFRKYQNWIGPTGCSLEEATYVPPPVPEMYEQLDKLEKFLHNNNTLPLVIKLALIHYQFEAIHPFVDGNGRIGRLIIPLIMCERRALSQPLLYLSPFFENHRKEYYNLLLGVSQTGGWQEWIEFFLRAIINQSEDAENRIRLLLNLQKNYKSISYSKRMSPPATRLMEFIFSTPVFNTKAAQKFLNVSFPTVQKAIHILVENGILSEITGKRRNKAYRANHILDILESEIPTQFILTDSIDKTQFVEAYLDIETTGLTPSGCEITVVGINKYDGVKDKIIQLVGKEITAANILASLENVGIIYTYNGSRFDLPFIYSALGVNLEEKFNHHDLMYDCWRNRLYGGLKGVEMQVGITRKLPDMNGWEAVKLWWKYVESSDRDALNKLLEYNREDIVNLRLLRDHISK